MSAIQDADGALKGLLDTIDDKKLRRVIEVIEATGQRPVLEPALAAMRPRLRKLRPQRPLTLPRLLTVPLELALVDDDSPHVSFTVCRGRLRHWQAAVLDRLDPSVLEAATHALADSTADDRIVALAVGRELWPEAAKGLEILAQPDADPTVAAEQHRVADLLALGPKLLPLIDRLLPLPVVLDAEDKAALAQIVDLGAEGPPDRFGTLVSALLRATVQPWVLASHMLALVPASEHARLRGLLECLLFEHRTCLEQLVAHHSECQSGPIGELALACERLADALTPANDAGMGATFGLGDTAPLRRNAAALATERCAAAIDRVVVPLSAAGSIERVAAQREREAAARDLAKLGRAAHRLAADTPLKGLTEAAIERLIDVGAARGERDQSPISVEDARLVEILVGPDIAWHYLRPRERPDAGKCHRRQPREAGPR